MDKEEQRKRIGTLLTIGIGGVGAVLVAPYIMAAIGGLVGLAVAGTIGFGIIQFAPAVAFKLANWRMKAIIAEAEKNPIETMQNLYIEKTTELQNADRNIADFETEVRNFDDQVKDFEQQYPDKADTYKEIDDKMHAALKDMKKEQTEARRQLQNFAQQINEAKAIYKMSLAAAKVVRLSKSSEAEVFAKIKEQVAFDSVRTQLNRSFSDLNLAMERRADSKLLMPAHKAIVADATPQKDILITEGRA